MADNGPQLSGQQYQGGVSNDDILAGEQYMQQREQKNKDEINDAGRTFSGGSSVLSRSAPSGIRKLFGGK